MRHCPGRSNIADLLSRGCLLEKLLSNAAWWKGPGWLQKESSSWTETIQEKELEEIRREEKPEVISVCPAVEKHERNSEKRKEKSRDAARCRRTKESEIFLQLSSLLPLPSSVSTQLDKSSVMRLTVDYLRIQELLRKIQTLKVVGTDKKMDHLFLKALEGFLLVLTGEGDMVYLSENVNRHLGLTQIDLLGHSIYDFCHPCDRDEIKKMLSVKRNQPTMDTLTRSFFIRMKCTLSEKGKSVNLRSASYKVIHCVGRVVADKIKKQEKSQSVTSHSGNHWLVSVGEPIPHPANVEIPLDKQTFLSRHGLDMKFTYVDERMSEVLGFKSEELVGKSVYQFHHAQDSAAVEKSFKTLFSKGQCETGCYRFLAKHGGYVWVITQATIIYSNEEAQKAQCVVCISYLLSDIENPTEIVSEKQVSKEKVSPVAALPSSFPAEEYQYSSPQPSTNTIFAPRTEDMNKGFLMFLDDESGYTVLKEDDAEDLTHLAPTAGDVCIPLEVPNFNHDLFEDVVFPDTFSEPGLMNDFTTVAEDTSVSKRSVPLANDPFLSYRSDQDASPNRPQGVPDTSLSDKGCSSESSSSTGSPPALEVDDKMNEDSSQGSEITALGFKLASPSLVPDSSSSIDLEGDEMEFRAPYIPMGIGDDLPLLTTPDHLWGQTADSPPPQLRTTEPCRLSHKFIEPPDLVPLGKSNLARLLQSSPPKKSEIQAGLRQKQMQWKGGTLIATDNRTCRERDKPLQEHSLQSSSGKDRSHHMNSLGIKLSSGFEGDGNERQGVGFPKQGQLSEITKVISCSSMLPIVSSPQNAGLSSPGGGKPVPKVHDFNISAHPLKPPLAIKRLCNTTLLAAQKEKSSKRAKVNIVSAGETISSEHVSSTSSAINGGSGRSKDVFKDSVLLNLLISGQDISHGYSCVSNKGDDQEVLPPTMSLQPESTKSMRKKVHDINLTSLLDPEGTTIPSLLDITPLDAEVNAPIQGTQHLLHGQDLLSALDTTLNAEVFL